ncbi:MAG: ABC transporter ATP-binding protein [Syntrophomonas sp.]
MYLQLIELRKDYNRINAVEQFSLEVNQGEFVSILGPSGCGKTTTLKMLGGFIAPSSGRITLEGKDITSLPPEKRPTATVFQNYALFPHMKVLDNVIYGLRFRNLPRAEILSRGREMLEMVGLSTSEQKAVQDLSGGEQQRIALARALVTKPKILLMDEPLSNLDAELRVRMREEIRMLQKRLQITTLYVTHDQEEALGLAGRIVVMNRGRIEQIGTPHELYQKPANIFVAGFIGRMNFLNYNNLVMAIRPENVQLCPNGDRQGVLLDKSFLGSFTLLLVDAGGDEIIIQLPSHEARQWEPGDRLNFTVPRDLAIVFNQEDHKCNEYILQA